MGVFPVWKNARLAHTYDILNRFDIRLLSHWRVSPLRQGVAYRWYLNDNFSTHVKKDNFRLGLPTFHQRFCGVKGWTCVLQIYSMFIQATIFKVWAQHSKIWPERGKVCRLLHDHKCLPARQHTQVGIQFEEKLISSQVQCQGARWEKGEGGLTENCLKVEMN